MPPAGYPAFLQYLQSGRVRIDEKNSTIREMARISRCLDDAARCNQQEVASQRITQVLVLQRVMATRFFLLFLAVSRVVEKIIDQWFGERQVRNDLACGNEGWVK